jgi:hypothetical protein
MKQLMSLMIPERRIYTGCTAVLHFEKFENVGAMHCRK